jgi:hypothetical protein
MVAACVGMASAAFAGLSATATTSLDSITGPAGSPTYHYTVTMTNTGTTPIGTFWYGWIPQPNEDYLSSAPTVVSSPSNWFSPVDNLGAGDGYSIEWYNYPGFGSPIAPNASFAFKFTSTEGPDMIAANSPFYPNKATQTSFIYQGLPEGDPGFQLVASNPVTSVPEAASLGVMGIGALGLLRRSKRRH